MFWQLKSDHHDLSDRKKVLADYLIVDWNMLDSTFWLCLSRPTLQWSVWPHSFTAPLGLLCSIWTNNMGRYRQYLDSNFLEGVFVQLCLVSFRPPDRRRRDVFGIANNTLFEEGGRGNTSLGPGDNSTDGIPPVIEYDFMEEKSSVEYLEIPNLRPFTVYRVDIHACNEEVDKCSIATFVFSRTKPAGKKHSNLEAIFDK